jgi:uncharacterized Ntn-hydrolase superfamily protein
MLALTGDDYQSKSGHNRGTQYAVVKQAMDNHHQVESQITTMESSRRKKDGTMGC